MPRAAANDEHNAVVQPPDASAASRPFPCAIANSPALKWFPAGSVEPEDYTGGRDLDSLVAFVAEKSGVKSLIKPPPPPAALTLDSSNFDDVVDGSKNVLVAFTAPWCGHCKNMKPAYEAVARAFEQENSHCIVANMNADEADNKDIAHRYGVRSFPTIKFFPKGEDEWLNYDLPRTEAAFTDFLNEHCGTQRAPGGILNDIAGRIASLDALASEFIADIPSRDDVLANAKDLVSGLKADGQAAGAKAAATADYYLKAMERIKTKGDAWLAKETGRLSNLLASSSLAPAKLDEIKVKINILKQFVAKKAGELFDDAEAAAQKIVGKDEL